MRVKTGTEPIVNDKLADANGAAVTDESVTVTAMVCVPAVVGVPLSTPALDRVSPAGTPVADQM